MCVMPHTIPPYLRGPVRVCDRKCVTKEAMRGSENVRKAEWHCVRQNLCQCLVTWPRDRWRELHLTVPPSRPVRVRLHLGLCDTIATKHLLSGVMEPRQWARVTVYKTVPLI